MAYYYTRDHLGSVREMTDSSGNIQARYDYDPYGRATAIINTIPSDFQYAGYYEHAPSGLNLTQYRAYDPITARWLSRDPLPDAERSQGPNLYGYVGNDPVAFRDPLGLCCETEAAAVALAEARLLKAKEGLEQADNGLQDTMDNYSNMRSGMGGFFNITVKLGQNDVADASEAYGKAAQDYEAALKALQDCLNQNGGGGASPSPSPAPIPSPTPQQQRNLFMEAVGTALLGGAAWVFSN